VRWDDVNKKNGMPSEGACRSGLIRPFRRRTKAERQMGLFVQRRTRRKTSPANAGMAKPSSAIEVGSGTDTVALIVDMPAFTVGALRSTVPALPPSAETIVKINPSRFCESGELNTIDALLPLLEIIPLIVPENVIVSAVATSVTVSVKVSLTVDGDVVGAVEDVTNVPKLTLAVGGTVAVGIVGAVT
jgi:hypothetical protein